MRRALALICAVTLLATAFGTTPARADSVLEFVFEATDTVQNFTQTSSGNTNFFIDLSKVSPKFFTSHYAVLDARITYDLAAVLDKDCPPSLTLYTSDATHALNTYVRRSAVNQVAVQRVAIAQPQGRYYVAAVRRDAPGVSTSGPCAIVQTIPFTITVKLFASGPASTGFGPAQQHLPTSGDGEPSIVVDRLHGDAIYVSAPVGIPAILGGNQGGVDFWRSLDHGATFSYSQPSFGNAAGGGDSHVIVDRAGDVFLADLGAAAIYVGKSTDQGASFAVTSPAGASSDRQWLASFTPAGTSVPRVYLSYHELSSNLPFECVSLDGGTVWQPVCNPMATDPAVTANILGSGGNTIIGPQVVDSAGRVFDAFLTPQAGDPSQNMRNVVLATSSDGIVFTNTTIATAPAGSHMGGLFPVLAVDAADDLYAVWSERIAPYGPSVIKLSTSVTHGATWSAPIAVSPAGGSALLPWVVAGNAGQLDIVWVGSAAGSANDPTADWYMYLAQTQTALTTAKFTTARITSQPVRYGAICLSGLGCSTGGDDGRILLDFTSNDIDSACNAAVTFANSGPEGRAGSPSAPYTDVILQTSGTTICH